VTRASMTRCLSGFPYNKVVTKTLYLLVLDYDRFSRDDPIGEVCLPLSELDLGAGITLWRTLMPCKGAGVSTAVYNYNKLESDRIYYVVAVRRRVNFVWLLPVMMFVTL